MRLIPSALPGAAFRQISRNRDSSTVALTG
jgi:hypothetical protein